MNMVPGHQANRTRSLSIGSSLGALAATLLLATPAFAQSQEGAAQTSAGVKVPDPAGSSSTAANPNEGVGAADRRAANAAVTGDVTAAQNEANAQAAGEAVEAATGDAEAGEIVVTGFRRGLEKAVVEKKTRDQIVESISAEDIGKLPDASIAESIARLPGLTSQRVSGRSQTISIRGFAPDFSTTLLNGREQTSTSDNRQVEFDQYPSEVINQVLVYKTPQASIVGQGLAGTVDLRTIRPIEFGRRVISVGGRGTYTDIDKFNPDSKRYGYRVNGTYVDQFLDDRLGVSLAASYIDEPYQFREYRSGGYSTNGPNGAFLVGFPTARGTSTRLKRFGGAGTVEFRPVPEFTSTIDGFYSDFKDLQSRRGVELPLGFAVGDFFGTGFVPGSATVTNGVVTAGTFTNVQALVRNDAQRNTAKLYSVGWNNAYKGDDGWNALLDLSYSRTNRSEFSFESYAGTGRGRLRGATETINFTTNSTGSIFTPQLDYTNPALFLLTDPAGYGGDIVQAGYFNDRRLTDEIYQGRTEVEKVIDDFFLSGVRVGMNYTRRKKTLVPNEAFVSLPNGAQEAAIPSQYLLGTFDIGYAFNGHRPRARLQSVRPAQQRRADADPARRRAGHPGQGVQRQGGRPHVLHPGQHPPADRRLRADRQRRRPVRGDRAEVDRRRLRPDGYVLADAGHRLCRRLAQRQPVAAPAERLGVPRRRGARDRPPAPRRSAHRAQLRRRHQLDPGGDPRQRRQPQSASVPCNRLRRDDREVFR